MSTLIRHPHKSSRRGFTLIEIMVVIAIIVILAGILLAVGSQIIAKSKANQTKATLRTLDALMKEYLTAGNPEPPSDQTTWVKSLRSSPEYSKKLSNLKAGTDTSGNITILDGWSQPILYIPYSTATKKEGYFESAGPDRILSNSDDLYSTDP